MFFDDIKVGMKQDINPVEVKKDEMIAFAKSYDNCPIHLDEEYAKNSKFGKLLSPGLFTFALVWSEYLKNDYFGEELLAGKSTKMEWFAPVFAGDTLYGKAEIIDKIDRNPKNGIVVLQIDIYNKDNVLVLTDITEAIVKKRING